ncbi:hypothetical protein FRC14_008319 [Serendipita sp. 396]|nr:hypothetical protein FRC14_008319 [Serendipita sp. 396]KAG8776900.1 hypothetical protein FRC15_011654 [Serendipita sp. 397]KAG8816849.1 hypothetical protein FRC18_000801 [Serendipita sp. 400]
MLHAQALSTQPTIDPPSSRVPLPKIQLGVHRLAVPSQEWYRKEPIITPLHPNRQPPTSLQLRPTPEELSNFPGRWRVHRKEPISTSPAPLKSINPLSALF